MIRLVRACRLAAAALAMMPIVSAAHAAEVSAPLSIGGALQSAAAPVGESHVPPIPSAMAVVSPVPASLGELVLSFAGATDVDDQATCLAKAVYFEARGESLEGQLAVAEVILNRASSGIYPDSICKVVTQKSQFSFIRRGRFPKVDASSDSWRRAGAIAYVARNKLARSVAPNVMWYHANYVSPPWHRWHVEAARIGTHIFYS